MKFLFAFFMAFTVKASADDCDTRRTLEVARISSLSRTRIVFNEGRQWAHIPATALDLLKDYIGYTVNADLCATPWGSDDLLGFEVLADRQSFHVRFVDGVVTDMYRVNQDENWMGLYKPVTLLLLIEQPDGRQVEVATAKGVYTGSVDSLWPHVESLDVRIGDQVRLVTYKVHNSRQVAADRIFLLQRAPDRRDRF